MRTGDQEPSPEQVRKAIRDVIGHCFYGVDINPDAVELCKVALWMERLFRASHSHSSTITSNKATAFWRNPGAPETRHPRRRL